MTLMTDNAARKLDQFLYAWKVTGALIGVCAMLLAAWTQFFGPGLKAAGQEFFGIKELTGKIEFLERNIAPPVVATFETYTTPESCTRMNCTPSVYVYRTAYGETCGKPMATAKGRLRDGGLEFDVDLRDFETVEATQRGVLVEVPLKFPSRLPPNNYEWRAELLYPNCPWHLEPIPRFTPWWPITLEG